MSSVAKPNLHLMIAAGETSGDHHAAEVLRALQSRCSALKSFGMGGSALAAAGMELVVDSRELAVIGFVDVVRQYPRFKARLEQLRAEMRRRRPQLLLLVDYPDFNLRLAASASRLGIPVLFYVSPQVWAWRAKRVHRIARHVDHMAVLFPFEVPIYEAVNLPVTHVGHPLLDEIPPQLNLASARRALGLEANARVLCLLPGSRGGELVRHLGPMLETARLLHQRRPELQFLLPLAPALVNTPAASALHEAARSLPLRVLEAQAHEAIAAADIALAASGTVTLECALLDTPPVILYVTSKTNHALMSRLVKLSHIGLVNIVAGRGIVPEFIQDAARAPALAAALERWLNDDQALAQARSALGEVRTALGEPGASERVAELVHEMVDAQPARAPRAALQATNE